MRLYLAAPFSHRERMNGIQQQVEAKGHEVTSRWHSQEPEGGAPDDQVEYWANTDLRDVARAHAIVLFDDQPAPTVRGGRWVEFGFALALGHKLWLVGRPTNIFTKLPQVRVFPSAHDFLEAL